MERRRIDRHSGIIFAKALCRRSASRMDCDRACRPYRLPESILMGASMKPCTARSGVPGLLSILAAIFIFASAPAGAATIVALGASNTYGKGVAPNQAYPAQLEAILRPQAPNLPVVNPPINSAP